MIRIENLRREPNRFRMGPDNELAPPRRRDGVGSPYNERSRTVQVRDLIKKLERPSARWKAVTEAQKNALGKGIPSVSRLGIPEEIEEALRLAGEDESEERAEAAKALGELKDPRAIPALKNALNDADEKVRLAAKEAIKNIRGGSER